MLAKRAPRVSSFTMQTDHVRPFQSVQQFVTRPFYVVDHDELRARISVRSDHTTFNFRWLLRYLLRKSALVFGGGSGPSEPGEDTARATQRSTLTGGKRCLKRRRTTGRMVRGFGNWL